MNTVFFRFFFSRPFHPSIGLSLPQSSLPPEFRDQTSAYRPVRRALDLTILQPLFCSFPGLSLSS